MRIIHLLSLILPTLSQQVPIRPESIEQPDFDLSSFNDNEIGILGNFDAISQYTYVGASNFTNQISNNDSDNLIYRNQNDQYLKIGDIEGGTVRDIIPLNNDQFLILGDFESIGDYELEGGSTIFNLSSGQFEHLNISDVHAALVDDDLIYLGGNFTFNGTNSAAIYNLTDKSLISTPFRGFGSDSHVNSIVKVNSNIIFGGKFDTLGYPQLLSGSYNTSSIDIDSNQLVTLRNATFSSSDNSSSPESVQCPGSSEGWIVDGVQAATLNIGLSYNVIPSKIRIYNSQDIESQISLFRLTTEPAGGIMNLTYVNPSTGELEECDAWCPLFNSTELTRLSEESDTLSATFGDTVLSFSSDYQDFGFVNTIDVTSLTLLGLESYGSSIGLAGFQIYQAIFSTFANNELNELPCEISSNYSNSELVGDWSVSNSGYLTTTVDAGSDVGVIFHPNITYAGEYSILLYTPGCGQDNACSQRGVVDVSVIDDATDEVIESYSIYQTNVDLKYDSVFYGHLNGSVRVEVFLNSELSNSDPIELVADRIGVTILSIDDIVHKNGSVPINGIFEYSPSNFTELDTSNLTERLIVGNTTINTLGSDLSDDADVSLILYNDSIIVAGDFESAYGSNFFELSIGESDGESVGASANSVAGGLNGLVTNLYRVNDGIVILGEFDDTNNDTEITSLGDSDSSNFNNVALFNGSWYSFPESIDDTSFTNITLNGDEYWVFGSEKWNASSGSLFTDSLLLSFNATAAGAQNNSVLFSGSLTQADALINKGFLTNGSTFTNITMDSLVQSSIETGLFLNSSLSVFGGEFNTSSGFSNLMFVGSNKTSGLNIDWSNNSTVTKLFAANSRLFIGSGIGGEVDGEQFQGVLVYNLNNATFADDQPPRLSSSDSDVVISEFGIFNNTYLVVGGEFDSASDVECSGLCFYNLNESSWESLVDSLSGSVSSFRFINNTLVISGDLRYDNSSYSLFAYDFDSAEQPQQPSHFDSLSQSVNKFILVDNSTSGRMIVSNEYSISGYDGSNWGNLTSFEDGSIITDIAIIDLSASNNNNNGSYFDPNQVLLASGDLQLPIFGYTSVAYYNSTHWLPSLIATHGSGTASVNSIFLNEDISGLYQSGSISAARTESSQTPIPSESNVSKATNSGKMDRGFVVLVSLAAAVGTVSLLGAIGAFLLYKKRGHDYSPLEPRVNETEMLDTVPPEDLLKHI